MNNFQKLLLSLYQKVLTYLVEKGDWGFIYFAGIAFRGSYDYDTSINVQSIYNKHNQPRRIGFYLNITNGYRAKQYYPKSPLFPMDFHIYIFGYGKIAWQRWGWKRTLRLLLSERDFASQIW